MHPYCGTCMPGGGGGGTGEKGGWEKGGREDGGDRERRGGMYEYRTKGQKGREGKGKGESERVCN